MAKAVEHFAEQLAGIRWGIPTAGLIDTIKVNYHGQLLPVQYLAHTQPGDGRIKVEAHDPTALGAIQKALEAAGFDAYIFSKTAVVVNLPRLATAADRDKVIAQVRKLEEEAKVVIRNIRKKLRQDLPVEKEERKRADKELQDLTDKHVGQIAALAQKKVDALS